jgi:formiminotetrahydrofolate cyclodeaminase
VSEGRDSDELAPAALMNLLLERLLADVAAATPAPGGGSSSGWACALGAALVEMTAAFEAKRSERLAEVGARAAALRGRALELAQRELHAYEPVLAALQLPREHPGRAERLDAALSDAAETPLELARASGEVATLALEAARTGPSHLRGDAIAGALIAEGACQAAARLVAINLAGRPDDKRLVELAELTSRAAAVREAALR